MNNFRSLNDLSIVEVYEYYDRPLLFSCRDQLGVTYLAVLLNEDREDGNEEWLYVGMSSTRFEFVRSGGIDLKTAFQRPETDQALIITANPNGDIVDLQSIQAESLTDDQLPSENEFLGLTTELSQTNLRTRAIEAMREIVTLSFNFAGYTRNEAPADTLGKILFSFEETMKSIASAIYDAEIAFNVFSFSRGSFGVDLNTVKQQNIYSESYESEIIQAFFDLVNLSDSPDDLVEKLGSLKPRAASKYLQFMKSISGQVGDANFVWHSPVEGFGGESSLDQPLIAASIEAIERGELSSTMNLDIVGTLRALNLNSRYFLIVEEDEQGNEIDHSGHVDKAYIESEVIQKARLSTQYHAIIEEKREIRKAISDEVITKTLKLLDPNLP